MCCDICTSDDLAGARVYRAGRGTGWGCRCPSPLSTPGESRGTSGESPDPGAQSAERCCLGRPLPGRRARDPVGSAVRGRPATVDVSVKEGGSREGPGPRRQQAPGKPTCPSPARAPAPSAPPPPPPTSQPDGPGTGFFCAIGQHVWPGPARLGLAKEAPPTGFSFREAGGQRGPSIRTGPDSGPSHRAELSPGQRAGPPLFAHSQHPVRKSGDRASSR